MDDFNVSSLHESKNEWGARLLNILTPLIIEGLKSIFDDSYNLCKKNNETNKYLMTFQNFISTIPTWNQSLIETETKRIVEKSRCGYLEELITCVHIIQLKLLTSARVGQKQKKIDINIPKLDDFIHKAYIHVARKIYKNVYLFEINIPPLQTQKNNRELEIIIQECLLNTIRDSIPIENMLRAYMDETVEEDVIEDIKEEIVEVLPKNAQGEKEYVSETSENLLNYTNNSSLKFNNLDSIKDSNNKEELISAPKDIERLEELSNIRNMQRKLEDEDDNLSNVKLQIYDEDSPLSNLDIHEINQPDIHLNTDLLLDDIEILT
jgi:hypothetical protein